MPTPAKRNSRVLILSSHPLLAGLLGILIELEGFRPVFADVGESPEDALARTRPLGAILADADLEAAKSDLFFQRASRHGIRLVLFRSPASRADMQVLAESRGLPWTPVPVDRRILAALLGAGAASRRRGRDRRPPPSASPTPDGTLLFRDWQGRRWTVYDRRSGPRRAEDRVEHGEASGGDYRAFISDQGEEWRLPLSAGESLDVSAAALEGQLAKAKRHRPGQGG